MWRIHATQNINTPEDNFTVPDSTASVNAHNSNVQATAIEEHDPEEKKKVGSLLDKSQGVTICECATMLLLFSLSLLERERKL